MGRGLKTGRANRRDITHHPIREREHMTVRPSCAPSCGECQMHRVRLWMRRPFPSGGAVPVPTAQCVCSCRLAVSSGSQRTDGRCVWGGVRVYLSTSFRIELIHLLSCSLVSLSHPVSESLERKTRLQEPCQSNLQIAEHFMGLWNVRNKISIEKKFPANSADVIFNILHQ